MLLLLPLLEDDGNDDDGNDDDGNDDVVWYEKAL